jgi:lipopolysaccharide export system protein LptA
MNVRLPSLVLCLAVIALATPARSLCDQKKTPEKKPKADETGITRISSKGRLIIDYENKVAEFFEKVKVQDKNGTMESNYLKIIFTPDGLGVSKMIATGSVVIRHKERTAYSDNAIYIVQTEVLRLLGNPKITEKGNLYTADEITVLIKQNKVLFEPSARILIKDTAAKEDPKAPAKDAAGSATKDAAKPAADNVAPETKSAPKKP